MLRPQLLKWGLYLLFAVWLLYPLARDLKYFRSSLADGESGYNQYNTRSYHESLILTRAAELIRQQPGVFYYSNIPPAVWFYTRHEMQLPPVQDPSLSRDQIKSGLAGWPNQKPGYYIWFEPDPFGLFIPIRDLALAADVQPVTTTADGVIVRVQPRGNP